MDNLKISRLKKNDCTELVEFLNGVFTQQNGFEMHFEDLYPRIFRPSDRTMGWHLAAKKEGKICGTVAAYPFVYNLGERKLKAASVGNVAVDMKCRGEGIMQQLMKRLCAECEAEGIDLCYLHGDRWRYRHFGFERCGKEICFHIKTSMLREDNTNFNYKFSALEKDNSILTDKLYEYYVTQKNYEERKKEDIYYAMTAKGNTTYVIFDGNIVEGYVAASADKSTVAEISIRNSKAFAGIIKSYMREFNREIVYINIPEYNSITEEAFKYADRYVAFQPGNFLVMNFKNVIEAYMPKKRNFRNLPDGEISIDSEIFGKWCIKKEGDTVEANLFEGEADFTVKGYDIYQFLFGTLPLPINCDDIQKAALAKAWLPVPLYCPYLS